MCWRDDVAMPRVCISCGQGYYGDLGHKNCPEFPKKVLSGQKSEGPVCPDCYSNNIEYLGNRWVCNDCQWQTAPLEFKLKPLVGINPRENISVDYGDDD